MILKITEIPPVPVKPTRKFNLELDEREALWLVALLGKLSMNEIREINTSNRVSPNERFDDMELGRHMNSLWDGLSPHFKKMWEK